MDREIRRSRSGSCNGSSRYEESGVIVEKEEWRSWKGEVSGEERMKGGEGESESGEGIKFGE